MAKSFRIALGQLSASGSKRDNLEKSIGAVTSAAAMGADMLVLPELVMAYIPFTESQEAFAACAEPLDGEFVTALSREAMKRRVHVVFGIYESGPVNEHRVYNTVVVVGPDGTLVSKHRKAQLFDSFGFKESDRIAAGPGLDDAFDTTLGKFGLLTCYELRFPEMSRILARQGAQVLVYPTAWVAGTGKEEHLEILSRARAIENTVFVAVASQTGRIYTGRSALVDPFGVKVLDAGEEEGVYVSEVDLSRIERVRSKLPSAGQFRSDIFSRFLGGAMTEGDRDGAISALSRDS